MQTFYRTTTYGNDIRAVEALKTTEKTITLAPTQHNSRERRTNRAGGYETYHGTFAEAKQHLIDRTQRRLEGLKTKIVQSELDLAEIQALTDPTPHETDV